MTYLLDTDTCIYIIKRRPRSVIERFEGEVDIRNAGVSSITVAELHFGAEKSGFGERSLRALSLFLSSMTVYLFGETTAPAYARLRAGLERQGTSVGLSDTLIAAHALSLNATLVINNTREFPRVPDLPLENWAEDA